MTPQRFPRADYAPLRPYDPGRSNIEVDLSDNTNLWGPHPGVVEVIRRVTGDTLTRYPSVYATPLKEAVARRFGVDIENVTTGCGSDDLLDSAFRASAPPPARLTYPDPTFSMIGIFARMNGMESLAIPWSRVREDPRALLRNDPDLVYLCRPDNPTGQSLPRAWLMELLEAVGEEGPLVVLDEAYADFASDHLLPEATRTQRLLVLRTFSKLYGMAGLRVGIAIGVPALIAEVEKSRGPYKVNGIAETAAAAALDDTSGWAEEIITRTRENRERLRTALESRDLRPLPSQANFLLIPLEADGSMWPVNGPAPVGETCRKVTSALRARGVAVRPFPDLPDLGDALRVSIGPWPLMARFLDALDDVLRECRGLR
jgi:histidinol-phosphate aminotransferase